MKLRGRKYGIFITVEGPEGSGKSTQIGAMARWFRKQNCRVRQLREPGGTVIGENIRALLLAKEHRRMNTYTELFLFLAARAQLVEEVILPALKRGEVVLCDRFFDSTVVYQGVAGGLGRDFVERLSTWGAQGLRPDVTFFFDIHYREGLRRTGRKDRMERKSLGFHRKVAEGYRALARRHAKRAVLIDGTRDIETVRKQIGKELEKIFH